MISHSRCSGGTFQKLEADSGYAPGHSKGVREEATRMMEWLLARFGLQPGVDYQWPEASMALEADFD